LGLDAPVVGRLGALGITTPLPIQLSTIPDALAGRDICAQAPTGSGKTLAFGLPLVNGSGAASRRPRALVIVPTRELADQVGNVVSSLTGSGGRGVVALYGGVGYGPQRAALRRGAAIVIGCPGRLEDLVARGDLDLAGVGTVVVDEADRMVDMGFYRPVCRLLDRTSGRRQVLLFSATMDAKVAAISDRYQRRPARHHVEAEATEQAEVTHHFWRVPRTERVKLTAQIVARHGQAFVFCRTKHGADRLTGQLRATGVVAAPIHGDRSQPQRARALAGFVEGRTKALVATDVVARGIHVDDIPCVVHFDLADDAATYVHRSGRTGRAGRQGMVVSLVPVERDADVRSLQQALGFSGDVTTPFAASTGAPPPRPGPRAESRLRGTVKFFDGSRGFGFLCGPDGADVYVHHSVVDQRGSERRMLRKGDRVTFELVPGRRGPRARSVVPFRRQPS
jgi:superfamily II DNA/RNA helicase/cold shock CspA family protein